MAKSYSAQVLVVCILLVALQTIHFFIPAAFMRYFELGLRPLVYGLLCAYVYVSIGPDARPVFKPYKAKTIAVITVTTYGLVFLALSFMLGVGVNTLGANIRIIMWNIWTQGSVLLLGELIRYKLIKSTWDKHRATVIIILTLVLAYAQLGNMSGISRDIVLFVFASALPALIVSAMASYFALKGSFVAVILVAGVFTMAPWLMPVLPQLERIPWALIVSAQAFVSMVLLYYSDTSKRRLARKAEKYENKSPLGYALSFGLLSLAVFFFVGILPIYPVVILTESMTGTINRGSLALVHRVPSGEAYTRVAEMDIIHFNQGGISIVHRVTEFTSDSEGTRQYITKGDANDITDPFPVAQEDVYGVVRFYVPLVAYPVVMFHAILIWVGR